MTNQIGLGGVSGGGVDGVGIGGCGVGSGVVLVVWVLLGMVVMNILGGL